MKVVLHDRTDGLGQELRENAERKLARLARHFGKVADAELEFTEERKRSGLSTFICRISVHLDGRRTPVLHSRERAADPQSAFDLAIDRIDRQLVTFKEKVTNRKQPASPVRIPPAEETLVRSKEPERVRMKVRPMSLSEAVSELEDDSQAFVVFLDEDSGEIQIAVKRMDGSVAVIEPVVT